VSDKCPRRTRELTELWTLVSGGPLIVGACTQRVEVLEVVNMSYLRNLRALHGVLMSLAWCVMLPAGVVVARLYKDRHPRWFAAHTALQTWGALLAIAGYAVVSLPAPSPPHPTRWHYSCCTLRI
jgi:hypothetical protein